MPIWRLMIKELIFGWTEKRKNPFFELSVGRCSISMWITKSILTATPYGRYLSLRLFTLMD
jgi:hypothetical protein